MLRKNELVSFIQDYASPLWGVIKWQMFAKLILELSRCEVRIDDILMYLPATISSLDAILHHKSNPEIALHATLATVHNLRGHRYLPYIDPVVGYQCQLAPTEDVFYHGCMLAFVDDAVQGKFPTQSLNKAYEYLSWIMKAGVAYSLYLALKFESDPEACQIFVPSLTTSSVPAGTMFSLLAMWKFPFDHAEKYTKNQLMAYTVLMYMVSVGTSLVLLYEYHGGNKFEKEAAGKYFESFFIAGASLQGLTLIQDFLLEKLSKYIKLPKWFHSYNNDSKIEEIKNPNESKASSITHLSKLLHSEKMEIKKALYECKKSEVEVKDDKIVNENKKTPIPKVPLYRRLGFFALNVSTTVLAGYALYQYKNSGP